MHKPSSHQYLEYAILVSVWPTPGNMYQSSFSVHGPGPVPGTSPLPLVYEEKKEQGMTCETAGDAKQDALERAHFWIEAQPD